RYHDLLATGAVQQRDIGYFRRLPQQLEKLDATDFDIAGVELGKRGVGKLALDLPDVLLDPRCGGERFLVLQARQSLLVLLVGKVHADGARREQGAGDKRQDEKKVLAEQPTAVHAPQ